VSPVQLSVGDTFIPPVATAWDEIDGDITHLIDYDDGGIDTNLAGTYEVSWTVTNSRDKYTIVTLEVIVSPQNSNEYTGYYQSLSGLSGSALDIALANLIYNTGSSTGTTAQVQTVDYYNGQNYNIYTGFGAYGNREHVWPASLLGSGNPQDDLHNLRAAVMTVNSTRANYPFTNAISQLSWQLVNGNTFYPGSEHVGDVARIVLYMSIRNGISLNLVGNLQMFLDWHLEDPVSDFEISRNNKIYNIQNNRNPFIDHPELVYEYFIN